MDIFIHVGELKSHKTLISKLKVPSSGFTFMHKPFSFESLMDDDLVVNDELTLEGK
jgi:hypothetical protein